MKERFKKICSSLLLAAALLSGITGVHAQTQQPYKLKGVVVDQDNNPVVGASIIVKSTLAGSSSLANGQFELTVRGNDVLEVSFIGYAKQIVNVNNRTSITVALETGTNTLEDVIVVGYGTQKRANLTGAVSSVKMSDVLGSRPVSSAAQALEGAIPGLQISRANGKPGAANFINLRGVSSINNSTTPPLVLVDHVPMALSMLDPNDIETVTVLKDAAAQAIYGARAANGVILITTKKAKKGDGVKVNYNNNFSFSNPSELPNIIDPSSTIQAYKDLGIQSYFGASQNVDDWIGFMDEYYNQGKYPEGYTIKNGTTYHLAKTDAFDDMMENFGFQQQHSISVMGSGTATSYRASFNMVNEDGILHGDRDTYKRYNAAINVVSEANKWLKFNFDMRYADVSSSTAMGQSEGRSVWGSAVTYAPWAPLGYATLASGAQVPYDSPRNLIDLEAPKLEGDNATRLLGRVIVTPLEGLEIVSEYCFDLDWYNFSQPSLVYETAFSATGTTVKSRTVSTFYSYKRFEARNAINAYATYKKTLNEDHNFSLMVGFNQEKYHMEYLDGQKNDLVNQALPSLSLANTMLSTDDEFAENSMRSGFYRLNYDYKGKYMIDVNGRYDGSSRFNEDGRFGFFPSFFAAWRISEEPFMEPTKKYLSNLRLRGSWGSIGNQTVSNYGYQAIMPAGTTGWILPGSINYASTVGAPALISTLYTWETVESLDFGLDLGMFNNQLDVAFDWYQRDTKDMLAPEFIAPSALGTSYPNTNSADLRTKGWEITVQWRGRISKDIKYNIGFNIYDSESEITRYSNISNGIILEGSNIALREGMRYGDIWGYVTDRYYTAADLDANGKPLTGIPIVKGYTSVNPGDVIYKDFDGNGTIDNGTNTVSNPGDLQVLGNNTARYQFGINGGISYKNFDLSFFFSGVGKRDILMVGYNQLSGTFVTSVYDYQADYWSETNPNSYWPRIYGAGGNTGANSLAQSKYIRDASYIRLKNLTVGYSLPQNICKKLHLDNLRVFLSGENLYTWDHLPEGFNPDMYVPIPGSRSNVSVLQGDSGAVNWSYPLMRQISFGVNLTF